MHLTAVVSQLPLGRAMRLVTLFALKRYLEPAAVISFGQRGEDLVLVGLLSRVPDAPPTYVDVGANHPLRNSNTFRLYLRGWHGVLVDANPDLVHLCSRVRPRDHAVCAAVSDTGTERGFLLAPDDRLGRLVEAGERGSQVVRPRTLTAILDDVGFGERFGILSVDCEGSDLDVLCSLDLRRYRPALMVVPPRGMELRNLAPAPVVSHLAEFGYVIVAYDGTNGYYVEGDD
jgi:FkbM family methyltransferase